MLFKVQGRHFRHCSVLWGKDAVAPKCYPLSIPSVALCEYSPLLSPGLLPWTHGAKFNRSMIMTRRKSATLYDFAVDSRGSITPRCGSTSHRRYTHRFWTVPAATCFVRLPVVCPAELTLEIAGKVNSY